MSPTAVCRHRPPGITAFARVAYSPPDRNLIDFYADGGIGNRRPVPGRPLDRFGMAIAYMHISRSAQAFDRDNQIFSGLPTPVRSAETLFEMIYEAHVKPGWLLRRISSTCYARPAASPIPSIRPACRGSATPRSSV